MQTKWKDQPTACDSSFAPAIHHFYLLIHGTLKAAYYCYYYCHGLQHVAQDWTKLGYWSNQPVWQNAILDAGLRESHLVFAFQSEKALNLLLKTVQYVMFWLVVDDSFEQYWSDSLALSSICRKPKIGGSFASTHRLEDRKVQQASSHKWSAWFCMGWGPASVAHNVDNSQ